MKMSLLNRICLQRNLIFYLLFLFSWVTSGLAVKAADGNKDVFDLSQQLGRGVNVLGYDPIWESFDKARDRKSVV